MSFTAAAVPVNAPPTAGASAMSADIPAIESNATRPRNRHDRGTKRIRAPSAQIEDGLKPSRTYSTGRGSLRVISPRLALLLVAQSDSGRRLPGAVGGTARFCDARLSLRLSVA